MTKASWEEATSQFVPWGAVLNELFPPSTLVKVKAEPSECLSPSGVLSIYSPHFILLETPSYGCF